MPAVKSGMGEVGSKDTLTAGRAAVERHHWRDAYELLRAADQETRLSAEDVASLAEAAWWNGRLDECISARERAYALYIARREPRRAARVAVSLAADHFNLRAGAVAQAWMKRAETLLQDEPVGVEHGFLWRLKARQVALGAEGIDAALELVRQVTEIGERFGEPDLIALGIEAQGRYLIEKGQVSEGMTLLEQATVAALAGELTPHTTGVVYCNLIGACENMADYQRAAEWTDAARRWCDRMAIAGFPGMCRVHRADVIRLRGSWQEAEVEARLALDELREFQVVYAAEAQYLIGEMRLLQGDLREAKEAFEKAHQLGRDPSPGLALLYLAEGRLDAAQAAMQRWLSQEKDPLARTKLLPTAVLIATLTGDFAAAESAATELEETARRCATTGLKAEASTARGAANLQSGKTEQAIASLCDALKLWREVPAPYQEARTRLLLASAYQAAMDRDAATLELNAARATFIRLGASLDERESERRLLELGQPTGASTAAAEAMTRTFLFTDIVRSTALVDAMGDDAWNELLRWHDQTLRRLISRNDGEEIKHVGDGIFASFHQAERAIHAAVEIQRTLADHRRDHGFAPQVRIGIHEAAASKVGVDYRGKGVHEAARIAAAAQAGEILASWETARTVEVSSTEPYAIKLRGVTRPIEVVSITWR